MIVKNLSKSDFRNVLVLTTNQSYFFFDCDLYKQTDGVAMGSPLGPSLANAFLSHHEKAWLEDCPIEFRHCIIEDMLNVFVLFTSLGHLPFFKVYLNSKHTNISFTSKCENNDTFPSSGMKTHF